MKSYYLVSYDHDTDTWSSESDVLSDYMPDGMCYDESMEETDGWFSPAWDSDEQRADGDALVTLVHTLWNMEKKVSV